MTIVQMEYLLEVSRQGSFSKAASLLFVTQPTLSMQIQNLEDELDVRIFDRSKKPLLLTEAGKIIVQQAKVILKEAKRMHHLVDGLKDKISGQLRLGILPTIAPYLLPQFVPSFAARYPEVTLKTEELTTDEILLKLKEDALDAGIVATPLDEKGIKEIPLFIEQLFAYVSPNHQWHNQPFICLEDIQLQELWLLKEEHCFRSQALQVCGPYHQEQKENFIFESGSLETLKRLVEEYDGLTILPEMATLGLSAKQKKLLKPFKSKQPYRQISLITSRHYIKENLLEALKTEILKKLPKSIKEHKEGQVVPVFR